MKFFLRTLLIFIASVLLLLCASTVQAHTGIGPHSGLLHGFMHPFSGLDHMLAMIAVGIWSVQLSLNLHKRAIWLMPAIFVMVMGLGGLLGFVTLPFNFVEHGIALSLLISGFLIARAVYLPFLASAVLIAFFAICHGYAHGSEMPDGAAVLEYAAGFMLATALLHVMGIGFARLAYHIKSDRWVRMAGVAVAFSGGIMLMSGAG